MAFDSPSYGQTPRRSTSDTPPEAPRPAADLWHSLRQEGIQWEGQVLVVGSGVDIPALLVLTGERLALIHEGTLALEAPRSWLRPEPRLLSENGVRVSMTPQGGAGRADETDRLTVRVRDGRGAAARLVSSVSGRLVSPREERRVPQPGPHDTWATSIGAATPIALPPLPDFGSLPEVTPEANRSMRAWPPVEQHAIPAPVVPSISERVTAESPLSAWPSNPRQAEPSPAGSNTSSARNRNVSTNVTLPIVEEDRHQFNRGLVWGLRSAILAVVVFTGLYFGQDSLPANVNIPLPASIEQRLGLTDDADTTDVSQVPGGGQDMGSGSMLETPVATKADSDGTNGPPNSDQIGASDDNDDGIGGQDGEITPVDPGIGEYTESTSEPEIEEPVAGGQTETEPSGEQPPVVEPTAPPIEPTSPPVTQAPSTDAPATELPATEAPVTEVAATETPETEAPVTETPVIEVPATETPVPGQPTEVPGRQDPTATATPDEEPTDVPATEAPEPTIESQPASVDPGSTPEQALASGEFRYSITGAARGETVDEIPDLNAVGLYGEWVVLSMYGQNWSDSEQVFDMAEFKLYADGEEVLVDVGNAWVSGLLGHTPAYGNTDAILWAADEGHAFALTFLAPPDAEQLTLVTGEQTIDLSAALANPAPLAQDTNAAPLPEYLDAEVVDILSAEEIVIRIDGIEQTVRYLGLDVPTGDDCFASDATDANRQLVKDKTVRLERQATDVDARGNWVRDVWAPADDGRYFLVAEALVADGAATVGISEPNTRYEGWLMGSQSIAKAEGRGLWGACEGSAADLPEHQSAIAPAPNRATYRRSAR